jgi:hypothetical protein
VVRWAKFLLRAAIGTARRLRRRLAAVPPPGIEAQSHS